MADYLADNLTEVSSWLENRREAIDWSLYSRLVLDLEGGDVSADSCKNREDSARSRITQLLRCDLKQPEILDTKITYPLVGAFYCTEEVGLTMGAWEFVRPLLEQLIDGRWPLRYIGRVRNSSPSEGSSAWHAANQRAIVEQTFEQKADANESDRVLSKQVTT